MSSNSQEQEIDLSQIGKSITNLFQHVLNKAFDFLFFIKSQIVIISILVGLGLGAAFLTDGKIYNHEVTVIPNFGSNEYLYKKIEQIDTKLREKDAPFFKELGVKNFEKITSIKIEAFPAIYSFVNNKDQENNFELIKLMAEDGNIDKIMKDELTSKNYYHHKIEITSNEMLDKDAFITPLLNYLNKNSYFETQQKANQKNLKDKITINDTLILQIDKLINVLSNSNSSGTISISEKNSIPELIEKKDKLIGEKQYLLTNEHIYDKIIKEESTIINIRNYKPLLLNSKVLFPIILVFLYVLGYGFSKIYKKQKQRIQAS